MEIIRNLFINHALTAQTAQNIMKFDIEDYRSVIEVSLSVAVCIGMLTFAIRAYFHRKVAVSDKSKETQITVNEEVEEVPRKSPQDEEEEEEIAQQFLDENVVQQLTIVLTDYQESDLDEDINEEETEEDKTEMDVRRIVDAIEKIKELDPEVQQLVNEFDKEQEAKDLLTDKAEENKEGSQIEILTKGEPEEVIEVRRQASLTMRKPYVVFKQSAPQAHVTPDKKATLKRSTSQGGHNTTTVPRKTRTNSGTKTKERVPANIDSCKE